MVLTSSNKEVVVVKKDKKQTEPKPKKPIVEDGYLWELVTKEIEPLEARVTTAETYNFGDNESAIPTPSQTHFSPAPLPPTSTLMKPSYELSAGDAREVNRAMAKQIKSGKYPVDVKIDLHGMTQIEAHESLIHAVEKAFHAGKRCLLVITGKGKFTQGGGVLRKQLPHWLNQANLRPYILMINEATPQDGGSGAFYVMIRRKRDD